MFLKVKIVYKSLLIFQKIYIFLASLSRHPYQSLISYLVLIVKTLFLVALVITHYIPSIIMDKDNSENANEQIGELITDQLLVWMGIVCLHVNVKTQFHLLYNPLLIQNLSKFLRLAWSERVLWWEHCRLPPAGYGPAFYNFTPLNIFSTL